MSVLDVFKTDLYDLVSMTAAINKLPYKPGRLGQLGIFKEQGVSTLSVFVEEQHGKLSILSTKPRGTMDQVRHGTKRYARSFTIPHIPVNSAVMADDVQGVRAFGSESEVEVVATKVAEKMQGMRDDIETTHEWHRIGALKGVVYDADGTTVIYDWFDEFGISPKVIQFDFSETDEWVAKDVKLQAAEAKRYLQDTLGNTAFTGIRALCGKDFWDHLMTCTEVKKAFDRQNESKFLRDQQARGDGFEYGGIWWEEYRGQIGSHYYVDPSVAYAYPEGADIFTVNYAPANFIETVNTIGKPMYAKQRVMDFDIGVELHAQSNPLFMCTRPAALIKFVDEGAGSS